MGYLVRTGAENRPCRDGKGRRSGWMAKMPSVLAKVAEIETGGGDAEIYSTQKVETEGTDRDIKGRVTVRNHGVPIQPS